MCETKNIRNIENHYSPSSLTNKINLFINEFGNVISKEDLQILVESRNMFMEAGVMEFIKTRYGEHIQFCTFYNDNIETCACFHFVIQQHRVRKIISSYYEIQK